MNSQILKPLWTAVNLLLMTALIYFGVRSAYALATSGLAASVPPPPALNSSEVVRLPEQRVKRPLNHYNAITKRNLFKTTEEVKNPKKKQEKPPAKKKEPELTQMNLALLGTVAGPPSLAYAIIEEGKSKTQSLKKIGDGIQNAMIKAIAHDHIIITVNGKDEVLKLEAFRTAKGAASPSGRRTPPPLAPRSAPASASGEKITVGQEKIESAVKNVNSLMKQVRIRPHFSDGKPDGLLLTGIRPGSIFADMGLKSGDIITGVDENPIESLDDALKFYESLKSAKDVKLEIRRRGQPRSIDYTIE